MKVFIAGASGAIGKRLVPLLVRAGHAVVGMTRTPGKVTAIRAAGAQAAVVDALDTAAVIAALQDAKPEVVVHELTAIPQRLNIRDFDGEFASTNRLRTEGTDNLLMGAQKAGVRRFVAQSYAAWPYAREGGPVKTEIDPLDPDPPAGLRETLKAIRHLESRVLAAQGMDGVVLRYGAFYGPGTSIGEGGSFLEEVRRRRFPVVGGGSGVWSFLHIEDAAGATLSAIERGRPGVYNIVDDDP
ncbi:MAG TPA: NAD(P)-dependent oxidoreductase, partial [Terriglobales bacterium]